MNKNPAITIVLVLLVVGGIIATMFLRGPQPATSTTADTALPVATTPTEPAEATLTNLVEFSLNDIDGNVRHLSEWSGKGRLVNFWATWCAPCRREIPLLKDTQAAHAANNVQVIGIAVDFQEDVAAYAEDAQFNYPILVGQEDAMAAAEGSGVNFIGLPFTMIVGPNGELLNTHVGEILEPHIDLIVDVLGGLEDGRLDVAAARAALDAL